MIPPAEADRRAWPVDGMILASAFMLLFGWVSFSAMEDAEPLSPAYVAGNFVGIKSRATDRFGYRFDPALPDTPLESPVYATVESPRVYAIANIRNEPAASAHVWLPVLKPHD